MLFQRTRELGRRHGSPRQGNRSYRLRVERLEQREVPAVQMLSLMPPAAAVENSAITDVIATFSGTNPDINAYTATNVWGDGSTTTGTALNGGIIANGNGTYSVVGNYFAYVEEGSYTLSVTVTDAAGGTDTQSGAVVVNDAPLWNGYMAVMSCMANSSLATSPIPIAYFTDSNPSPDLNDFTATINWGDGTSDSVSSATGSIVPLSGSGGMWAVMGNHTYGPAGLYSVSVNILDNGGATTVVGGSIIVANPSPLQVTPYDPTTPLSTLTNALFAPNSGLTLVGSSFVGQQGQAGTYTGLSFQDATTSLSLPDGILLTSGLATNALGPNNTMSATGYWATPGDPNLDTLVTPEVTFDANALTLDFTAAPGVNTLQFKFVFGSEEFPEWVGQFNDVFGAYLDGTQISFDPMNNPISVNNNFFQLNNSGDTTNPYTAGKTVVTYDIQYDGLTPMLTTQAALDPTITTHTLKFVIADTRDQVLDSGVFLSSLTGNNTGGGGTGEAPEAEAGGPYSVAAGGSVVLDASATLDADQNPATLDYKWDLNGNGIFGETGSAATHGDEVGIHPTFLAGDLPAGSTQILTLMVTDNTGLVSTATAEIHVTGANLVLSDFPSPVTAGQAQSFTVVAHNADGSVATNYTGTVHFTSSDGQAVLPTNYTFKAADHGRHTFKATLETAGTQSLTVTDLADPTKSGTQGDITVNPAAAKHLIVSDLAPAVTAGEAEMFTVTAVDLYGNVVPSYAGTVKFASTDPHAIKPPAYSFTAGDLGSHSFAVTFETAGTRSITASDSITGAINGKASTVVSAADAAVLVITSASSSTVAGDPYAFTVTAKDAFGNVAIGYTGTVHITSGDMGATLPADHPYTATDAGAYTFGITLTTAGARSVTATDTADPGMTASKNVLVKPASADHFVVSGPATAGAGKPISITVKALDRFNNLATGYLGTVRLSSTDGLAGLPTDYPFGPTDRGKHTFVSGVTLKTAGSQSVIATDLGSGSITGVTAITVLPATAVSFRVEGFPTTATAGVAYSFSVTALDTYGNVATGYHGKIHFSSSDPAATLPVDYLFSLGDAGHHDFLGTLFTPGLQSITAIDKVMASLVGTESGILVV